MNTCARHSGVSGNCSCHQARQRASVRRATPSVSPSRAAAVPGRLAGPTPAPPPTRGTRVARGTAPTWMSSAVGKAHNKNSGATKNRAERRRDSHVVYVGSRRGAMHLRIDNRLRELAPPVHGQCAATAQGTSGRTGGHGTLGWSLILVEKRLSHSDRLFKVAEGDLPPSLAQLDQIGRQGHQLP